VIYRQTPILEEIRGQIVLLDTHQKSLFVLQIEWIFVRGCLYDRRTYSMQLLFGFSGGLSQVVSQLLNKKQKSFFFKMSTQQQKKPYLDTCTVPHYGTVTNGKTILHLPLNKKFIHIYIYADKSIEDGRNKEFVFQSLVVPDLRHIGIKTSLSYPADDEALSYNIKSGLRDAISQAYRR